MKKLILTAAIMLSCLSVKIASAQISLSINIGSQPDWGPVGYDHADYYYMPDIDSYYDVNAHQYIYLNGNIWTRSASLPPRYANYDVYNGYKVVVNDPTPWRNSAVYRQKYASYRGVHNQTVIRDSKDTKYRNHYNDRTVTRRTSAPRPAPARPAPSRPQPEHNRPAPARPAQNHPQPEHNRPAPTRPAQNSRPAQGKPAQGGHGDDHKGGDDKGHGHR